MNSAIHALNNWALNYFNKLKKKLFLLQRKRINCTACINTDLECILWSWIECFSLHGRKILRIRRNGSFNLCLDPSLAHTLACTLVISWSNFADKASRDVYDTKRSPVFVHTPPNCDHPKHCRRYEHQSEWRILDFLAIATPKMILKYPLPQSKSLDHRKI